MLPLIDQVADYKNVIYDAPMIILVWPMLLFVGAVLVANPVFWRSKRTEALMIVGLVLMVVGFAGGAVNLDAMTKGDAEARQNMNENVKSKYAAELIHVSEEYHRDVTSENVYTLRFEDGVTGQYKIRFENSGEPVLIDDGSPSAKEVAESARK